MNTTSDIMNVGTKWNHICIVPYRESATNCDFSVSQHVLIGTSRLRLGRFTDTFTIQDRISFKSLSVSREHAEIYVRAGEYYIRDTKSSTGTFVNNQRLSPPNQSSKSYLLKEGDIVQLGMNFHENGKEVYRCVKMKVYMTPLFEELKSIGTKSIKLKNNSQKALGECCICLSDMEPDQTLYSTPCSHTFHLECCRPLFKQSSIFKCPLCRSHVNLRNNEPLKIQESDHGLQFAPI